MDEKDNSRGENLIEGTFGNHRFTCSNNVSAAKLRSKESLGKIEWDVLSLLHEEGKLKITIISEMLEISGDKLRDIIKKLTHVEGLSLYETKVDKSIVIGIEHCNFAIKPYLTKSTPIVLFGKRRIIFKSLRQAAKMLKKDKRTLQKLIDEGNTLVYKGDVYCIDELFRGEE